ncbi:hypothetical protein MVEN_00203600 [Mycena venus]|uniref:Uncharacterized protein n=1 Tax=Mycena venus TaxID=2733690 RepID=A0A8H7DBX6_9AGAR|nr:hypothetical protein MVEN_00203600 [Mycena venus]
MSCAPLRVRRPPIRIVGRVPLFAAFLFVPLVMWILDHASTAATYVWRGGRRQVALPSESAPESAPVSGPAPAYRHDLFCEQRVRPDDGRIAHIGVYEIWDADVYDYVVERESVGGHAFGLPDH